ncbi:hypothetical protein [Streptomyces collinus]|uniref:hypothetical protein n=1 Tax=Streptomyces collinus TaxID=42684 RepID=UPI0036258543
MPRVLRGTRPRLSAPRPVDGPRGTAAVLATLSARCLHTHLNHTNPLVDPAAPQLKRLARLGVEVADDGMVIEL